MRRALMVCAIAVSTVGAMAPPSGIARACSCADPVIADRLLNADTVVVGHQLAFVDVSPDEQTIDRRWLFEVEQRYRGDTTDVIEVRVQSEVGSCDDTATRVPSVLLLDAATEEGWYPYPACNDDYLASALTPFFDEVWPIAGRGPPSVIAAIPTADHDLAVLDELGRLLGYLPGTGWTIGLSICPESTSMLQLRVDSEGATELAVWDLSTWSEQGTMPIDAVVDPPLWTPIPMTCLTAAGTHAFVAWEHGLDVDVAAGAVTPHGELAIPVAVGPHATLQMTGDNWFVQRAGESTATDVGPPASGVFQVSSTSIVGDGWEVVGMYSRPGGVSLRSDHVGPDAVVRRLSLDLAVEVFPLVAVALDDGVAASLPAVPDADPRPLWARGGVAIPGPAPLLPGEALSTTPTSVGQNEVIAVIAPKIAELDPDDGGDDDRSSGVIVLVLVGVVAAGVAWALVRRRPRSGA